MNSRGGRRRVPGGRVPRLRRAARWTLFILAGAYLIAASASEDATEVAAETQVALLLKVLTYDRTLAQPDTGRIGIAILHDPGHPESLANRDAVLRALATSRIRRIHGRGFEYGAYPYQSGADLAARLVRDGVHVLYVARGLDDQLDSITVATRRHHVLTIAGVSGFVAQGISVGMVARNQQPRILLNLAAVKAEGHDMSANLLRLCEVVR